MEGLWQGGVWDLGAPSQEIDWGQDLGSVPPQPRARLSGGSEGSGWGAAGKKKLLEIAGNCLKKKKNHVRERAAGSAGFVSGTRGWGHQGWGHQGWGQAELGTPPRAGDNPWSQGWQGWGHQRWLSHVMDAVLVCPSLGPSLSLSLSLPMFPKLSPPRSAREVPESAQPPLPAEFGAGGSQIPPPTTPQGIFFLPQGIFPLPSAPKTPPNSFG